MKVLLSVVGIGLGHATRSEAIYKELKKHADVKVITWGPAAEYFRKNKIPCGSIEGFDYKGEQYTFNVFFNTIDTFRDPTKLKREYFLFAKQADEFKPDVVISDSDPNALFFAHRRRLPNFVLSNLITTIDNYEAIPKELRTRDLVLQSFMLKRLMDYIQNRTNRIFVPSFESKVRFHEKVKYTDLIVRKRPMDLLSEKKLKEKLLLDKDFYYVSVGGSDIEKYLFHTLLKTLPKFEDKYFIVSSNYLVNKVIDEKNMKIVPFVTNALEYIKASKGIIAPAGHSTISEAICFKKPILAVPVLNHIEQLVNTALLKKDGFGEACFFKGKVNQQTLEKSIKEFFKNEEKIQKKLSSVRFYGKGAEQIAKAVLNY
jgi:uncharacterized protein (TIGR00661 family)